MSNKTATSGIGGVQRVLWCPQCLKLATSTIYTSKNRQNWTFCSKITRFQSFQGQKSTIFVYRRPFRHFEHVQRHFFEKKKLLGPTYRWVTPVSGLVDLKGSKPPRSSCICPSDLTGPPPAKTYRQIVTFSPLDALPWFFFWYFL